MLGLVLGVPAVSTLFSFAAPPPALLLAAVIAARLIDSAPKGATSTEATPVQAISGPGWGR